MRTADRRRAAGRGAAAAALATATATAAVLTAIAGAGAACGKDELAPGEVTSEVAIMLEHLPGDARAVIGVRAARVRAVPALARLIDWMPAAPVHQAIAENCGLDPRRGVDLALATVGGAAGAETVFVALQGSFTRSSVATCVVDVAARRREPLTVTQEGPVTVYGARGQRSDLYWPTQAVAIAAPLADNATAALSALAGQAGVRTNPQLMSYVSRVRTGAAFWMAGLLPPEVQKQMSGLGSGVPALQGFFASADGEGEGGGVRVLLGLRLAGEKEARAAAQAFRDQRGVLAAAAPDRRAAAIVDKLELAQAGSEVVLQASLNAAEAGVLIDLVAGMTGLPAAESRP